MVNRYSMNGQGSNRVRRIYVMRHGESVINIARVFQCKSSDGALTEAGREQAQQAAVWLQDKDIRVIYASPIERATETATIVGKTLGLAVQINNDLREIDCGDLDGRNDDTAWESWRVIFRRWVKGDWTATYPGGESLRQGYDRMWRALNSTPQQQNTLLVTHGGIMHGTLPLMCVNHAALKRIEGPAYTGIVILEPYHPNRYSCESWNLVEHLSV